MRVVGMDLFFVRWVGYDDRMGLMGDPGRTPRREKHCYLGLVCSK